MISFRKFSCFLTALALMAFALPGMAASPDKLFNIAVDKAFLPAGTTTIVKVTFTNVSPKSGNSYINSLIITAPVGASALQPAPISPTSPSPSGSYAPVTNADGTYSIKVSGITGVKPSGKFEFYVAVTVPVGVPCPTAGTWVGQAYAGNSFNGDPFTPSPTVESNKAAVTLGCEARVACSALGTPFAFTDVGTIGIRGRYNKDGSPCIDVGVNFTIANNVALTPQQQGHLEWDIASQPAAAFMYSINWQPMAITDGDVTAGYEAVPGWPSKRPSVAWKETFTGNPDWIPGLACVGPAYPVPYGTVATSDIPTSTTNGTTTFSVKTTGSLPLPGTTIIVELEKMLVTGATPPNPSTQIGTLTVLRGQEGTSANVVHLVGVFVTGTPVLLPAPLVALAGDISDFATAIPVGPISDTAIPSYAPPPVPFPAVINNERILVTALTAPISASCPTSTSCWTATRGVGGTFAVEHTKKTPAGTGFDTYVMSTPLPIVPLNADPVDFVTAVQDYRGKEARMCIAEHGFVSVGVQNDGSGNPVPVVQYYTTVVDIGDGYVGIE